MVDFYQKSVILKVDAFNPIRKVIWKTGEFTPIF